MIAAAHSKWADRLFKPYVTRLLKKHFNAVHVVGDLPAASPQQSIVLIANHSSWWDGFFIYLMNKRILRRRPYLMMLERELAKNRFFSKLGAFSIDPGDTGDVRSSLKYAAGILKERHSLLCIFPQGELLPWGRRPLGFERGLASILRLAGTGAGIVLAAIRIEYLKEQRPDVFFMFQALDLAESRETNIATLEAEQTALLARLESAILSNRRKQTILTGKPSINRRFEAFRGLRENIE